MPSEPSPEATTSEHVDAKMAPRDVGNAVRGLLGIPIVEPGNRSMAMLATPSAGWWWLSSPLTTSASTEAQAEEPGEDEEGAEPTLSERMEPLLPRDDSNAAMPSRSRLRMRGQASAPPETSEQNRENRVHHDEQLRQELTETRLTIPGVTTQQQHFPGLSSVQDTPATVSATAPPQASPTRAPEQPQGSRRSPTPATRAIDAGLLARIERYIASGQGPQAGEADTQYPSDRHTPTHGATAPDTHAPQTWPSASLSEALGHSWMQGIDRSNTEFAAQLAQLRRMVRALATKVAPPPEKSHNPAHQPQGQTAAPRTHRMVIINRPAPPFRIPRAFWERRHLSRWYLRTPR